MPDLKYISVINNGVEDLYIKDAEARQEIEDLKSSTTGGMHYIGKSTTPIANGDATGPWTIDGKTFIVSGTPAAGQALLQPGDVAIYGELEFVWSGTAGKWQEFGSTGSLKALAFKDNASGSYTPGGSNADSAVSFAGTTDEDFVTGVDQPAVLPTFTEGAFAQGTLPSYTEGAFSQGTLPAFTEGAFSQGTLPTFTEGAFSQGTLPSMTYDSNSEKLTFGAGTLPSKAADTFNAGTLPSKAADTFSAGTLPSKAADSFSAGTLPTKDADTFTQGSAATFSTAKAITGLGTATAAGQTFTGTAATITVE